jgi:site-specific recombinase XerD
MRRLRQQDKTNRFVFMNERGAPMTAAGFRKMLARVRQAAGLDVRAHPHMLRHACGYHLANRASTRRSTACSRPNRFKNFWED